MRSLPLLLACLTVVGCSAADETGDVSASAASGSTAASGTGGGGGAPSGPIGGHVTRYEYAFDLASAKARSTLQIAVDQGGDCFSVDCRADAAELSWDGAAAQGMVGAGKLSACGPGVAKGGEISLGAAEAVPIGTYFDLDVGFSRKKDMSGGEFSYLLSWVGGCDRFGPCDADPARLAQFHFEVSHAPSDVVLCAGTLTAGSTETSCDLSGTLAPTYSAFAVAADPSWQRKELLSAAGVTLVFYEVPGGKLAASLDPASVGAFMQWIAAMFGPFPYGGELRVAGAPTTWLGFEHPANIVMLQDLPSEHVAYFNPTMHVLMHETTHQWAGDRVTLASALDFVWKEATAEYIAYVFEDEHRPPAEAAASLAYWKAASLQAQHFPRPTDAPPPPVQSFYGDVYGPGPMVLYQQLEALIGRKAVLAGIDAFLAQPGARGVDDLRQALEGAAGQSLGPYFDAWVFGPGAPEWPTFALQTAQNGADVLVTLTQKNASNKLYGCAVEVDVSGATKTMTALVDFGLAPASATASATVPLGESMVKAVVDPRNKVVARLAGVPNAARLPPVRVWPL